MHVQPSIIVEPYDRTWPAKFETEKRVLRAVLAPWLAGTIEHIGSTAVPGLPAKPVIDIMGAVRDLPSSQPAIEALQQFNYCYFPYKAELMHWFCKPTPPAARITCTRGRPCRTRTCTARRPPCQ